MNWIFFRTDANRQIGSGHLHRCLILADAITEKLSVKITFIFSTTPKSLHNSVLDKNYHVFSLDDEAEDELASIKRYKAELDTSTSMLIIDSDKEVFYSEGFQKGIINSGMLLFHITFKHEEVFFSHLILNQNLLALSQQYDTQNYTTKLLGPSNAILKPKFRLLRDRGIIFNPKVKNILISFGGADLQNVSSRVLENLCKLSLDLTIILVLGKLYKDIKHLNSIITNYPKQTIQIYQNTPKMPELMAHSDLAITSGGLTAWELACLGTPNVIISTSWRESSTAELLDQKKLAVYLGHHDNHKDIGIELKKIIGNVNLRQLLYNNGLDLVDGKGSDNVVYEIKKLLEK